MSQVPGWNLVNENGSWKLHQSWKVKTFVKGMEFLRLVADVAEAEGILHKFIPLKLDIFWTFLHCNSNLFGQNI